MKPPAFEYQAPASLEEALSLLAQSGPDAKLLAGGQSLVPLLSFRLAHPALLVDLNRVEELAFLRRGEDDSLRLGAMTRQRVLERDPRVAEAAPLLAEAVPYIAHPQIRNRGTVGGSLAHADPAAELPAVMVALGARFRLLRSGGERWVKARDFYLGLLTTDLGPDELLAEVAVPPLPAGAGWAFTEVARRHGDYAQVGVAAWLTLEGGACRQARLVYLSVGDLPVVAERAAAALAGRPPSREAFQEAAELAAGQEIDPAGDIHASAEFKRHLTRVLTVRALERAAARARGEGRGSEGGGA